MKKIVLNIEGMSCSACSNGLEKYLKKQEGIEDANVNLVLRTASIIYNDKLNRKDIERFIKEAGFKSTGINKSSDEKESILPLIIWGILCLVIMYYSMAHMFNLKEIISSHTNPKLYATVLFILTIPFLLYGFDIIRNGIKNIIHKMPNMDTLVSIGIMSSVFYSIYSLINVYLSNNEYIHSLYFESTVFVIYFVKLGRYLSNNSKSKTTESIKELVKMTPNIAHLKTDSGYKDITIDEVKKDDILICLPGEKIAVDGEIIKGYSNFDESFITGESKPVLKKENSKVIAGSLNYESVVEYKAEKIGKNSTISEIVNLVLESTNSKTSIEKTVDKICSYFVPIVIIISVITFILNLIITKNLQISIERFITVLVVSCPCSLGLATPLALVVSVGELAKKGILIKDSESLEIASDIDTVIFDKTGTLTYGIPYISSINNHSDIDEKELLDILISLEKYSNHPLAKGVTKYAKENKIKNSYEFDVEDLPGYGIKGKDEHNIYYACNNLLLKKLDITNSYEDEEINLSKQGNSIIYLVKNKKVLALISLIDTVRKSSAKAINDLKSRGINVIMLTGDNKITALKIGMELGIDKEKIISETNPKEKQQIIKKLVNENHKVIMVGDGINDAPSLQYATIGISLNSGTDIATSSANIVLINNNLNKIQDIINISRKTNKIIKQNLFWAFIYNVVMITIATGIIRNIKINPMIACITMILSSLTVTFNALRLKKK